MSARNRSAPWFGPRRTDPFGESLMAFLLPFLLRGIDIPIIEPAKFLRIIDARPSRPAGWYAYELPPKPVGGFGWPPKDPRGR